MGSHKKSEGMNVFTYFLHRHRCAVHVRSGKTVRLFLEIADLRVCLESLFTLTSVSWVSRWVGGGGLNDSMMSEGLE